MMPALNAACKSEFRTDNYLGNGNNDIVVFINMQNNLVYAPCLLKYKSNHPAYKEVELIATPNTGASIYRLSDTGLEYRNGTKLIKTDTDNIINILTMSDSGDIH
jgi:hypothetical protein